MSDQDNQRDLEQQIDSRLLELTEESKRLENEALTLQDTTMEALGHQLRWWRRLALVGLLVVVLTGLNSFNNRTLLNHVDSQQEDIQATLQGVQELVEFVREAQADTEGNQEVARALIVIYQTQEILCRAPDFAEICRQVKEEG